MVRFESRCNYRSPSPTDYASDWLIRKIKRLWLASDLGVDVFEQDVILYDTWRLYSEFEILVDFSLFTTVEYSSTFKQAYPSSKKRQLT